MACKNPPANVATSGNDYYYYPDLNAYYDKTHAQFVYTTDGGTTWNQKPATVEQAERIPGKVIIQSATPNPWQLNAQHRSQYGGAESDYRPGDVQVNDGYPAQAPQRGTYRVEDRDEKDHERKREKEHKDNDRDDHGGHKDKDRKEKDDKEYLKRLEKIFKDNR